VAGERRHAVEQEERARLAAGVGQAVEGLGDARGGLRVDDEQRRGVARRDGRGERLAVQRAAPLGLHPDDVGPVARELVGHPLAEQAVHSAHDPVAGPHEVGDHRLHARATRAADRDRDAVLRLEDGAQPDGDLVHQRAEGGIEVPDGRLGERAQDALGHGGGSRAQQQALGQGGDGGHRPMIPGLASAAYLETDLKPDDAPVGEIDAQPQPIHPPRDTTR